jgi:hypothetical protein
MNRKDFLNWAAAAQQQPEYVDFRNTMKMNNPLNEADKGEEVPLVQTGPGTVKNPTEYSKMVYGSDIPRKNKDKTSFIERIVKVIGGLRK